MSHNGIREFLWLLKALMSAARRLAKAGELLLPDPFGTGPAPGMALSDPSKAAAPRMVWSRARK